MPWLSNAIIGGSACPDASPMKRSPTTIGTPVTWQSDYLTGVESVAYAYQVGARSIAAVRYPAAQAAPGLASTKSLRSYKLAERDSFIAPRPSNAVARLLAPALAFNTARHV